MPSTIKMMNRSHRKTCSRLLTVTSVPYQTRETEIPSVPTGPVQE
jgi:hypothetical protein